MIVYKWVIKKDYQYYPIINNGAFRPFNNIILPSYKLGQTIRNFINPWKLLLGNSPSHNEHSFHMPGFHFWKILNDRTLQQYQRCMEITQNKTINCLLKCYVRNKDIIKQDDNRLVAKKFRVLSEISINEGEK